MDSLKPLRGSPCVGYLCVSAYGGHSLTWSYTWRRIDPSAYDTPIRWLILMLLCLSLRAYQETGQQLDNALRPNDAYTDVHRSSEIWWYVMFVVIIIIIITIIIDMKMWTIQRELCIVLRVKHVQVFYFHVATYMCVRFNAFCRYATLDHKTIILPCGLVLKTM